MRSVLRRLVTAARSNHRLPRRTLRGQLTLLYAAVFGLSCVAAGAIAVIFKPNFLVETGCSAAPGTPSQPDACGQYGGMSFLGTVTHDAKQNPAGLAVVAVAAVLALGIGWLIAGRVLRPLRTITATEKTLLQVALADPDATMATLRSACEEALQWNGQQERLVGSLLTLANSE